MNKTTYRANRKKGLCGQGEKPATVKLVEAGKLFINNRRGRRILLNLNHDPSKTKKRNKR